MRRSGFGRKDGSRRGWLSGGRGRNKTSVCRHPAGSDLRYEIKEG